jgi:Uncharacterized enzyme of heme biosynthesis
VYASAVDCLQQALTLFRQIGDRGGEAVSLNTLGIVYRKQGHYERATGHLRHALAISREIGDRYSEAQALNGLGETWHAAGQLGQQAQGNGGAPGGQL